MLAVELKSELGGYAAEEARAVTLRLRREFGVYCRPLGNVVRRRTPREGLASVALCRGERRLGWDIFFCPRHLHCQGLGGAVQPAHPLLSGAASRGCVGEQAPGGAR